MGLNDINYVTFCVLCADMLCADKNENKINNLIETGV